MKHHSRKDRGGFLHIVLGLCLLGAVGATSVYGDSLNKLIEGKKLATRIAMSNDKNAECAANTVETFLGTLGCGSVAKAAHLNGITFMSATKKTD